MPEVKMDFIPDDMSDDEIEDIDEFNQDKDKTQEEIYNEVAEEANIDNDIDEAEIPHKNSKVPKAKSKRDDMNVNEIFNMPEPVPAPNVKLTKKGKPRKQRPPMSEEHKKKLALAREKAMEARKKKAQEKKEAKELEKEEKELLKKQKVKRVKQLKEQVENNDDGSILDPPISNSKKEQIQTFSKKDLEEAQLEAIMKYETIRKQRKKEKQEKQKKDAEEEAIRQQLRRAVAPPQEYNPFSGCY